jgi:hypothetical protein
MAKSFPATIFLVFALLATVQAQITLSLEVKSSKPNTAQIYYDVGSGFSEAYSAKAKLKGSGVFEQIKFTIPVGNLKALRFDPLENSGSVELRSVKLKSADKQNQLLLDKITPANQIAKTEIRNGVLLVETQLGALDPQLTLPIPHESPTPGKRIEATDKSSTSLRNIFSIKPMKVKDIVASQIVMADGNKTLDYFYFLLFWIILFLLLAVVLNISIAKRALSWFIEIIERGLSWLSPAVTWLILPLIILAGLLFSEGHSCLVGWVSALSIVGILIMHLRSKLDADHAWVMTLGPWAIFSFASGILSLANLANVFGELKQPVMIFAQALTLFIVLAGIFLPTKHVRTLGVFLATVTPMGLFCSLPYFSKLGINANSTHLLLASLIFTAVLIITFDQLYFGLLTSRRLEIPCRPWIWLAIPAILLPDIGLPTVSPDFFHFGEVILPFQQWWSFGTGPSEGFTAIQYGHAYMPGALNQFLFGGGATTFGIAAYYSTWLLVTLCVGILLTFCRVPCVILLALVITGNGMPQSFGLILAVIGLFALFRSKNNFWACLVTTPLAALFCLLWHPSTGLPLAGLLMFTLFIYLVAPQFWGRKFTSKSYNYALIFLVACGVLAYACQPALKLALENSFTNSEAHGIQMSTMLDNVSKIKAPFEISRLSFLLVSACAVAYALFVRDVTLWPWPRLILIIFGGMILSAGLLYGGNRIDPNDPSRIGFISMFACAIWCFAVSPSLPSSRDTRLSLALIWMLVLSCYFILSKSCGKPWAIPDPIQRTLNRHNAANVTPPKAQIIQAPGLGAGYFEANLMNQINFFSEALEALNLSPNETWFDLTNNQAYYAYFNRPSPGPYSATFNVVNVRQTKRMINALEASKPPLTFISPSLNHEGVPPSLRSYGLYKWVLLRGGRIREINGFTFIDHRDGGTFSTDDLGKLSQIFNFAPDGVVNDLRNLPSVWGRSIERLQETGVISDAKSLNYSSTQENMIPLKTGGYKINFPETEYLNLNPDVKSAVDNGSLASGYEHYQTIGWSEGRPLSKDNDKWSILRLKLEPSLPGTKMEFLQLDLDFERYDGARSTNIDIRWKDNRGWHSMQSPMRLIVHSGRPALLPMAAYPAWLLSDDISEIAIYFPEYRKLKTINSFALKGHAYLNN